MLVKAYSVIIVVLIVEHICLKLIPLKVLSLSCDGQMRIITLLIAGQNHCLLYMHFSRLVNLSQNICRKVILFQDIQKEMCMVQRWRDKDPQTDHITTR